MMAMTSAVRPYCTVHVHIYCILRLRRPLQGKQNRLMLLLRSVIHLYLSIAAQIRKLLPIASAEN